MTRYRTIVADPPWDQKGGPLTGEFGEGFAVQGVRPSQHLPYQTMTVERIAALPIADLADENCHLYLWATNKYLPRAFEVMEAWGFRYSSTQTWGKALMGGGLGGTFRINCEFFLFGYRGRCDARDSIPGSWFAWDHDGDQVANLFDWKRPYDERGKPRHSAKPPEFFAAVERVSHGPYLELFSRERRPRRDWHYWGDQSLGTASMPGAAA